MECTLEKRLRDLDNHVVASPTYVGHGNPAHVTYFTVWNVCKYNLKLVSGILVESVLFKTMYLINLIINSVVEIRDAND